MSSDAMSDSKLNSERASERARDHRKCIMVKLQTHYGADAQCREERCCNVKGRKKYLHFNRVKCN